MRVIHLLAALWLGVCATAVPAQSAPATLVMTVINDLGHAIEAAQAELAGPKALVAAQQIVQRSIVPRMDFPRITRDAVGNAWSGAGPVQRSALETEFRQLLTHVLARLVVINKGETLVVADDASTVISGDTARVTAQRAKGIPGGQNQPVVVSLVRGAEGWRIVELRIDGIEVVKLYSANFAVVMEREGGIDGLVRALAARNAANAKAELSATAAVAPAPRPARAEDFCVTCSTP
jgi:phospholipid transport system substrate-binding protein